MKIEWSVFKGIIDSKTLSIQYTEDSRFYYLSLFDGPQILECELDKNPSDATDLTDFETNYKANGNKSLWQYDTDGAQIVRTKAAKKGWSFWALPIEITTSAIGASVYAKDSTGTDIPGITGKIYNSSNVEITVPGLLDVNLGTCTKTVVDFEPAFDYELIGGALSINSNPAVDARVWIIGAPDIPAIYGGSREFASGINLKFLAPDSRFEIDGRVTKYVPYNATTHSGKLRIIVKHPAGTTINMQIIIHTYRA